GSAQGHEGEMTADPALLDGSEHRLVRLDVDVDVFQLADRVAGVIDQALAVPFGDVAMHDHFDSLLCECGTLLFPRPKPKTRCRRDRLAPLPRHGTFRQRPSARSY